MVNEPDGQPETMTAEGEEINAEDLSLADAPVLSDEQLVVRGQKNIFAFAEILNALGSTLKLGKKTTSQLIPAIRISAEGNIEGVEEARNDLFKQSHPERKGEHHYEGFLFKGLFDANTLKGEIVVSPSALVDLLAGLKKSTKPETLVIAIQRDQGNGIDYVINFSFFDAQNKRVNAREAPFKKANLFLKKNIYDEESFATSFQVPAKDLKKLVDMCANLDGILNIRVQGDRVFLSAGGEIGAFDLVTCHATTRADGTEINSIRCEIAILQDALLLAKVTSKVTVWLNEDFPLKVVFNLKNGGSAIYYLAYYQTKDR
jgi:hypothetical protein